MKNKKIFILILALVLLLCQFSESMSSPIHPKKSKTQNTEIRVPDEFLKNSHFFTQALLNAPFPYFGEQNNDQAPFFKTDPISGEKYHLTNEGKRYPESTYKNDEVIFYFPKGFNPQKSWAWAIYLHGHLTFLEKHLQEQEILNQVEESEKNIIFVAPSFAVNASDSSPGKLLNPNGFKRFIEECKIVVEHFFKQEGIETDRIIKSASKTKTKHEKSKHRPAHPLHVVEHSGVADESNPNTAQRDPVTIDEKIILMSYSGGYKALAFILDQGGVSEKIFAVLQLDSFYAEIEKFEKFFAHHPSVFWINFFSNSTANQYEKLKLSLKKRQVSFATLLPDSNTFESKFYFIEQNTDHFEMPQKGPPFHPVSYFLKGLKNIESKGPAPFGD